MSYTFRLVFSGLCAFVPNRPFNNLESPPDHVDVILPNIMAGQLVPSSEANRPPDILVPHFPYLKFDPAQLRAANDLPLYFVQERVPLQPDGTRQGICPLNWCDIEIWPEGRRPESDTLRIVNGVPHDPIQPQTGSVEMRYLRWLIDMGKIHPGSEKLKPELLQPLAEADSRVIARVKLQAGQLYTDKISDEVFEFHPVGSESEDGTLKQKVALQLALELDVEHEVKIVLNSFDGTRRRLVFAPPPDHPYDDIEIMINNRELDPLFEFPPAAASVVSAKKNEHYDPDFKIFYDLSIEQPMGGIPLPHAPFSPKAGAGGGDHRPCSPAGFSGVGGS